MKIERMRNGHDAVIRFYRLKGISREIQLGKGSGVIKAIRRAMILNDERREGG